MVLKFRKFQPRYFYKLYSYKKKRSVVKLYIDTRYVCSSGVRPVTKNAWFIHLT